MRVGATQTSGSVLGVLYSLTFGLGCPHPCLVSHISSLNLSVEGLCKVENLYSMLVHMGGQRKSLNEVLTEALHGLDRLVPEPGQIEDDAQDEDEHDARLGERHSDDVTGLERVHDSQVSVRNKAEMGSLPA